MVWFKSVRFGIVLMGSLAILNLHVVRNILNFTIICMVRSRVDHIIPGTVQCFNQSDVNEINKKGEFNWPKDIQGFVLGSFFLGYCLLQFPSGIIASKYGSRNVVGIPLFLSSILTLFIPVLTRAYGYKMLISIRFFTGLFLGVTHPAVQALFGYWILPNERSKSIGISYSFAALGNLVAIATSAPLCAVHYDNGWPLVYYLFGFVGLAISCLWVCLVTDTPNNNRFISLDEIEHIKKSLEGQVDDNKIRKQLTVPWKAMLTSIPFWAILVLIVSSDWVKYTFEMTIPIFLKNIVHFNLASNGLISSLPYIAEFIIVFLVAFLGDILGSKVNTTFSRKIISGTGLTLSAATCVGLAFITCKTPKYVVGFIIIGAGSIGLGVSTNFLNAIDIAPSYAGVLSGITNTISSIVSGFGVPLLIGYETGTYNEWKTIFFIGSAVGLSGTLIYCIFSRGNIQDWAKKSTEPNEMTALNSLEND